MLCVSCHRIFAVKGIKKVENPRVDRLCIYHFIAKSEGTDP